MPNALHRLWRINAWASSGQAPPVTYVHHTADHADFMLLSPMHMQSLEDEMVRPQVLRLVSLPLWHALSSGRLQLELHAHPQLAKHWKALAKKEAKAAKAAAKVGMGVDMTVGA